jgi:hypothetical protein
MPQSPNVQYLVSPYNELRPSRQRDVTWLVHTSVSADYPERNEDEIAYFRRQAREARRNLTRGIGGPLLRRTQSFARATSLLAIQNGELQAYIPIADNVSSDPDRNWIGRVAERQAKLHRSTYIGNRYAWFGYMAMSQELRQLIMDDPSQATLVDGMSVLGLDTRVDEQPVSIWPWEGERVCRAVVTSWKLSEKVADRRMVQQFGPDSVPVTQYHYVASPDVVGPHTVAEARESIMSKPGAAGIVAAARANLITV